MELTSDWLDCQNTNAMTVGTVTTGTPLQSESWNSWNCFNYPYFYYPAAPPKPIRLTLAEVDRLRKTAKSDEKLKDILKKFTSQIEVIVDLE